MARPPQTFANHVRYVPLFHFVCLGLLMVYAIHAARRSFQHPDPDSIAQLALAVALLLLAWYARSFALTVQDRVIRLEMRLRMQQLAPELVARFGQLSPAQLAALRFAGDAELPDLARQVLDGKLGGPAAIKKAVRDWQGDYLRV